MIAFTLDTDWAPLELVRGAIDLIHEAGCKVTVFCTDRLEIEADEIAIHPNFTDLSDLAAPIGELKQIYPQARGLRSHALLFTERFRPLYDEFQLSYDANAMQYLAPGIQPTRIARRTVSLPLFFMDRFHMEMAADREDRWCADDLPLKSPGLKIFDFHPIHLFLNTPNVAWYERAKPFYHEPNRLRDYVADGPGARTLLVDLLHAVRSRGLPTLTLSEIERTVRPQLDEVTAHAGDTAWK